MLADPANSAPTPSAHVSYKRTDGGIASNESVRYVVRQSTSDDSGDSDNSENGNSRRGTSLESSDERRDESSKKEAKDDSGSDEEARTKKKEAKDDAEPPIHRGPKRTRLTMLKPPKQKSLQTSKAISSDEETSPPPTRVKKGKTVTGKHRTPSAKSKFRQYDSSHYHRYDIFNPQPLPKRVTDPFKGYGQYKDYLLYCNPDLTDWNDIPKHGVRVDDLTIMRLYKWGINFSELHKNWPADFDQQGMVRATRVPLGYAAKIWKEKGERDLDHKAINQAGWYYIWYADIHQLPGDEGFDQYTIRPSHEKRNKEGVAGTKMSSWASVQDGPGKW